MTKIPAEKRLHQWPQKVQIHKQQILRYLIKGSARIFRQTNVMGLPGLMNFWLHSRRFPTSDWLSSSCAFLECVTD